MEETEKHIDTEYENLLDVKSQKDISILDFVDGISEDEKNNILQHDVEWKKHWIGMPEFIQDDNKSFKSLIVNFDTEEDYNEFSKLINQKLTNKTKSIRFPKLEKDDIFSMRWVID